MEVKNCKSCGRLFNYFSGEMICQGCKNKLDEKFSEVKEYIHKNPGVGMQEVATNTGVSFGQIKQWVREERLEFTKESLVGIDCERCGVSIRTGRFCKSCKLKLATELKSAYSEDTKKSSTTNKINTKDHRIRFLN